MNFVKTIEWYCIVCCTGNNRKASHREFNIFENVLTRLKEIEYGICTTLQFIWVTNLIVYLFHAFITDAKKDFLKKNHRLLLCLSLCYCASYFYLRANLINKKIEWFRHKWKLWKKTDGKGPLFLSTLWRKKGS